MATAHYSYDRSKKADLITTEDALGTTKDCRRSTDREWERELESVVKLSGEIRELERLRKASETAWEIAGALAPGNRADKCRDAAKKALKIFDQAIVDMDKIKNLPYQAAGTLYIKVCKDLEEAQDLSRKWSRDKSVEKAIKALGEPDRLERMADAYSECLSEYDAAIETLRELSANWRRHACDHLEIAVALESDWEIGPNAEQALQEVQECSEVEEDDDALLAREGLRRAGPTESGWYYKLSGRSIWVTDEKAA